MSVAGSRRLPAEAAVTQVPGVGPARAEALAAAGIETVEDLLLYLPLRYEDRSTVVPVTAATPGRACAVEAVVERCRRVGRGRRGRVEAIVRDDSGGLRVVWFGQPYVAGALHRDDVVLLFGKVSEHEGEAQLVNPVFEKVEGDRSPSRLHVGRLVPIYRRIGKLTPGVLRRLLAAALERVDEVAETLPGRTRETLELIDRAQALRRIHAPPDDADAGPYNAGRSAAHRRLVCEEFLAYQTALLLQRPQAGQQGIARRIPAAEIEAILAELPFTLTAGQRAAIDRILADMRSSRPMHRLLQGDVGCGKTAVAGCALLAAAASGCQAAIMAPTEILARQHEVSLGQWARARGVPLACLTGSTPPAERGETLARLADGRLSVIVGTHALLEEPVAFADLGLAVVDEQHRFGVRQRAALRDKGRRPDGRRADLLVMTATPIPRTLALTLYGDLDVSTIPDMPPGRQRVVSEVVPASAWTSVVERLLATVARGEQAYVVAPRIEAGEDELGAAVRLHADLQRQLDGVRVGLLHGAQGTDEKAAAMASFARGDTDVLAATTVIEVGVDVANATLMVVGHAESFGLAQLHQLRGRVGRGERPSACVFIAHEPVAAVARQRLEAIAGTDDGFVLAEKDLDLRGPGEVLGTRQAGIADLRVGDPFRDLRWLEATRAEAERLARAGDPDSIAYRERVAAYWHRRFAAGAG